MSHSRLDPLAGPDAGNTGPSEADELEVLSAHYGEMDEDGFFTASIDQDEYADTTDPFADWENEGGQA